MRQATAMKPAAIVKGRGKMEAEDWSDYVKVVVVVVLVVVPGE